MTGRAPLAEGPSLRTELAALVADRSLAGRDLARELTEVVDRDLARSLARVGPTAGRVAVVALGSYARRELCPGSDIDVLLLHARPRRRASEVRVIAESLWYPLWDAGLTTGHGARTVGESLRLADTEPDALTAMLAARHVAGDPTLTDDLLGRVRDLAVRRRERLVLRFAEAATARRARPGPIAEMLEPDLKDGAGGLRDVQALGWAGWALGSPGGLSSLEQRGYVSSDDVRRLHGAADLLLEVRTALHRTTGTGADRLVLQEQDAVAAVLGYEDADALVHDLTGAAREVAWIVGDSWARLRDAVAGPEGRVGRRDRSVAAGVVLRDGRVTLTPDATLEALTVLEAASAAAELDARFDRSTLARLGGMDPPTWGVWERAAFLRLLRQGERAVPVFEALDHQGVLARLLPEWEHVRSRPQRNAYHRHTVDRHLLEAVSACARLLDAGDATDDPSTATIDAVVARATRRPELLLLGALLHDVGKGHEGDHSEVGARIAERVARRIGLDGEGREVVTWLVRDHLRMADTASRRDLSDPAVVDRFVDACAGDPERLRLLYLLTVGDSQATGPAAWSRTKAALLRDLFVKAAAVLEDRSTVDLVERRRVELAARVGDATARRHLDRLPASYVLAFDAEEMSEHTTLLETRAVATSFGIGSDGRVTVTVAAPDEPGLLARIAGALNVAGLSVGEALLFSTGDGMALDVFRADDPFGRVGEVGQDRVGDTLDRALDGDLDLEAALAERARAYDRPGRARGPVEVAVDLDASDAATVVEVHSDDEVGVLWRIADTFARRGFDVTLAKVATLGDRVVDVFYVRDGEGKKVVDREALSAIERDLLARLGSPPAAGGETGDVEP